MKTIGERIVFLREELDISQKELAATLKITPATLSRYENDIYEPKGIIIAELAQSLHTSSDFLLGLNDNYTVKSKKSNSDFTAQEYRLIKYYRALSPENKIRLNERAVTLLDLQND